MNNGNQGGFLPTSAAPMVGNLPAAPAGQINVLYINNDGGGFAGPKTVPQGTTISDFFFSVLPNGRPSDYNIRVNQSATTPSYVLQHGDRVSFTPVKIEGAKR